MIAEFYIKVHIFRKGDFNFRVEHYESSEQVERFRVFIKGENCLGFEKRKLNRKQPWKVISTNFEITDAPTAALTIFQIEKHLDNYLAEKK